MKRKDEKGYLTIEATISLIAFWFFMMFIMNMGQVYRAQNYMNHGLLQTGKMLAFSSYDYKHFSLSESVIDGMAQLFNFQVGNDPILYNDWRGENYNKAVIRAFGYCAGENEEKTNDTLKQYGIKDGVNSITFQTNVSSKDIEITAEYQIQLPFAFFGFDHITMHQQVKCGLWS